uniref:Uncharacterized protein n=1 Tax=Parascaris equorum TaxID=6256 RepID=A0A914SA53_PAREQ
MADSRVRELFSDGCVAEVIQEDESGTYSGTEGKEPEVLKVTCERRMSEVAKVEEVARDAEKVLDLR